MTRNENSVSAYVFLSYTKSNRKLADVLINELKKSGIKVWNDQNIKPGNEVSGGIKKALESCNSMIALLDEHSFSSSYVRKELQFAFFDERYKNRLLPVFIGDKSDISFSRLPWILNELRALRIPDGQSFEIAAKMISKEFFLQLKIEGRDFT